ncbi:hypothetical protein TIFTF001_015215 [Ficus carica]|uniref:Putative plant transposon protein domain-containing protein n=1 Tax=Ficus carica TaxID=3494 RepID=A0AA88AL71_FICCA|nr:hypothetical protein TIFTF001_015215 [Ficus carica]
MQDSAVATVVREFNANGYYQRDNDEVCVRGTMVSFAMEVINREMCTPGTEWTIKENDSDVTHYFPENCLNIYAKAWNKFICASIMPTNHEHQVYTNRAALLYAIYKGWSIDIGVVIRDDLVKSLETKMTGAHTHPCLITGLCRNAGVTIDPAEPLRPCGTSNPAWVLNSMTTMMHLDLPTYSRDFAFWEGGIKFEEFQPNKHVLYKSGRLNQQDRVLHEVLDRVKDMQQHDIIRSRYELQFHQYLASQDLPNSSTAMPPAYPDYLLRPYHPPPPPPETREGSDDNEGM